MAATAPAESARERSRQTALLFDHESAWAWQAQPQGAGFRYLRLPLDLYRGLRKARLNVDILPPATEDFSGCRLIAVPGLSTGRRDCERQWSA